jgi:penicillin-binding protein 1C
VETEWLPAAALRDCLWHRREAARVVVAWPEAYRDWARTRGLLDALAPPRAARGQERDAGALRILSPPPGAVYLLDPGLRVEFQTLPLRGVSPGAGRLTWRIDGRRVGDAAADQTLDWPLERGEHVVAVWDDRGRRDETTIEVR